MPKLGLPLARPGQKIGLLGGSFDPPHAGHRHISLEALKRFGLDQVWWLVSPGNPFKTRTPAPMAQRLTACRQMARHPRLCVSDFEARIGSRHTAHTLRHLIRARPGVRFVWLMGADNLALFDKWQDWRSIIESIPLGVLARPGQRISGRMSKAAHIYAFARLRGRDSLCLAGRTPPAWCFVNAPMLAISSTELRGT